MRRREFISLLGGAALAWPANAHGQKTSRIGVLYIGTADEESLKTNLREGLRELGYVEGQNVAFSLALRKESWSDFLSSQLSSFDSRST